MFLFRPSNNNQRYAFVPLLDQSDNDNSESDDGDEEKGGKRTKKNQFSFVLHLGMTHSIQIYHANISLIYKK
jgi:hypothetical protein